MIIQADFLIEVSLINLGLILALYTLVIEKIEDLRDYNNSKKNKVSQIRKLAKIETNNSLKKELIELANNIDKTLKGYGYEYDYGYFVSAILYIISMLIGFIILFWNNYILVYLGFVCLLLGIINFSYVWFKTMIAFRRILKGKLEIENIN